MDKEYIIQLLQRYFTNQATHTEREALFAEVEKHKNNEDWVELLATLRPQVEEIKEYNPEHYQSVINTILATPQLRPDEKTQKASRVIRMWKWIAAACIMLLLGIGTYVILSTGRRPATEGHEGRLAQDVPAPKETRAVITLANGSKVYLDSVDNGTIAQENNVNVLKTSDGKVVYQSVNASTPLSMTYNTLSNPRGSKVIDMTLSDGSHVWLNSGSSIKYPVAFIGKERIVDITGEAYFEVKHNSQQPFKVHLPNGSVVEDIGTSFNVNAYADEDAIKTTLIEGSVRFTPLSPAGGGGLSASPNNKRPGVDRGIILKPGEQAISTGNSPLTTRSVDLEEVLAWKNGKFYFHSADLPYILRQAQRWYDVDVVYETKIEKRFNGEIDHNTNLSNLLKALELSGDVKFRIEGKKIIVTK